MLGAIAARRLGLSSVHGEPHVWLGDRYWTVVGILRPVTLDGGIDRAALVGLSVAQERFGIERNPSKLYLRADEARLAATRALLAPTINHEHPEEVQVSGPSDALEAKAAAEGAFTSLLLGLGAVALLVGGVGIANVMVISVLERRSEIGLRRALGATRRHIGAQFITEACCSARRAGRGRPARRSGDRAPAVSQGLAPVVAPIAARRRHRRRARHPRGRRPVSGDARGAPVADGGAGRCLTPPPRACRARHDRI